MAAAASLASASLNTKSPRLPNPKSFCSPISASFGSAPIQTSKTVITLAHPLRISSPKISETRFPLFRSNVAYTSEIEEEEEEFGTQERNYSRDLQLFVGNLPFSVDSAKLADLFGSVGTVEMVEVIYDKITGRSRGFGFVTMSTVEEVEAAAGQFNGYEVDGRPLRVNAGPAPPKNESSPRGGGGGGGGGGGSRFGNNDFKVYVGNLSWGVDDMSLRSLFSDHGEVSEAKVIYDRESGRSKGFGFVTFSSPEECDRAIDSLDGAELDGRPIRVRMAEARPPRY